MNKEKFLLFLQEKIEMSRKQSDRWFNKLNVKLTESEYYEARIMYNDCACKQEIYEDFIQQIKIGKFDA